MILLLHRWEMAQKLVTSSTSEGVSVARSIQNALDLLEMTERYEVGVVCPEHFPGWEVLAERLDLVLLSGEVDAGLVEKALRLGVKGVLPMGVTFQELKVALDLVKRGQSVYPSGEVKEVVEKVDWREEKIREVGLTPKEVEVLVLTARGRNAVQVARELGNSPGRIRNLKWSIYEKLGLAGGGQGAGVRAVMWAIENGLV